MPKLKCVYCRQKSAQRKCPAVGGSICSFCCGSNRLSEFDCPPDCDYLGSVGFYQESQKRKELGRLLETVPCGQFDDILQDIRYVKIAYEIENSTATLYAEGTYELSDLKVKEAYYETYRMLKGDETVEGQDLSRYLRDLLLKLERKMKWERNDIKLVLLRLIISVKKMSGSRLGLYSYLNYIRDNIMGKGSELSEELKLIMKDFGMLDNLKT